MICPFCKAELSDHATFCTVCGRKIPRDAAVTDGQQASASGESGQHFRNTDDGFIQTEAEQQSAVHDSIPTKNMDPKLAKALKGINTMNILQIICLVVYFLHPAASLLLLVVLIMSLSLTKKVSSVFSQYGYPLYVRITDRVRTICKFLIVWEIAWWGLILLAKVDLRVPSPGEQTITGIACVIVILAVITLYFLSYCFCRLYTVKEALECLSFGYPLPSKPSSKGFGTVVILLTAMVVLGLIGIVASITLPAYSLHMKKDKFQEVVSVADDVKKLTELCFLEHAENGVKDACNNINGAEGKGWKLLKPEDYHTKYVDSAMVRSTDADKSKSGRAEAVITVNANQKRFSERVGEHVGITIIGTWNNGKMEWITDPSSSCKAKDLC